RTTDVFQLATAVLFQSPIQHFGLTPNNLEEQPGFVIDFLKDVPAAWDETRFIAGYPGRLAVLARRHGDRWYVGATNGEAEPKKLTLCAPFLAGRALTLIHDRPDRTAAKRDITLGPDGCFDLALEPAGGAVLFQ
ncbi:MAG: glycoside hydrolase family 97 C-terminal domain-containing protein, partial [Acidobacteriota bacterium]